MKRTSSIGRTAKGVAKRTTRVKGAGLRSVPRKQRARKARGVVARDLMRKDVLTVATTAPLSEVEQVLSENRIGGAPVVDETGAIVGVISVRDLVARYAEDPDARPRRDHGFYHLSSEELLEDDFESFDVPEEAEETAADVMTGEVYSVTADATLPEIARTLVKHRIHRVLVEVDGRYVGLIGTFELLDATFA